MSERIQTQPVRVYFEECLLNRAETEFAKGGNFWLDTVRDRTSLARRGVTSLGAQAVAQAALDAVEIAAWLETAPVGQTNDLTDATSSFLQSHSADYSKLALSSAARSAHAALTDAAAQWVSCVLKSRLVFDAAQVIALARAVAQAAEFGAVHYGSEPEVFPYLIVVRQLQKQVAATLAPALSALMPMAIAVDKLGALRATERKSRLALQAACVELLEAARAA